MSKKSLVAKDDAAVEERPQDTWDVVEATPPAWPFLSFSYSVTEISRTGQRTRVKTSSQRLAGGKLVSENFEGEIDGGAYQRLAQQATEQFFGQLELLMQPF